jgi:predicted phage tail component-like protein
MSTNVTLDGVSLAVAVPTAKVLRVRRQLVGARRETFVDVPGRAGAWVFPSEPGDRSIRLDVDIAAASFALRRQAVRKLAEWADTLDGRVRLIVDDEPDRYHAAVLASAPDVDEWLLSGEASLEYRADPYAYAVSTSSTSVTASAGTASGAFAGSGDVAAYPVIEITPLNGTLTAFTVQLNGDTLSWSDNPVPSGATVTVSSISYTITTGVSSDTNLSGVYIENDVVMQTVTGRFPVIVAGTNTYNFTTTGTATAVRFRITWRARYR